MRAAAARGGGDGAAGQGTRRTPRMLGPRPAGCGADEGAKGAGLMVSEGHKKRHHRSLTSPHLGSSPTTGRADQDGRTGVWAAGPGSALAEAVKVTGRTGKGRDRTRRDEGACKARAQERHSPPPLVTLLGAAHPPQMVLESMTTSPGQQRGGNGLWWRQHAKAA